MKKLKVYVAGKVSKDSEFGTHYWRDDFVSKLEELSKLKIENLDPTKLAEDYNKPEEIFGADADLISRCDVLVVYLSDDISVGGSQEILIAKYFGKPVIGLAPRGGKFNGARREQFGKVVDNYQDPFVFTTCDVVCGGIEETAEALKTITSVTPKNLDIIEKLAKEYSEKNK